MLIGFLLDRACPLWFDGRQVVQTVPAQPQDHDTIGDRGHIFHVVTDPDHAQAALPPPLDQVEYLHRSHYEMGTTAAEMLTTALSGRVPDSRHVAFQPELVVRESTGPVKPPT